MKYLVIPPYSDPTLIYEAPPGWQVYDLMQAFMKRILTQTGSTAPGNTALLPSPADREERTRLLLLEGGKQLLEQADQPQRWLRACGAIMSGQPHSGAVHLRLDDLEIVAGTTEASEDVQRAADQDAPYTPELRSICAELADAETIHLLIETDKQLPAAAWLAQTLVNQHSVKLSGRFALRHAATLKRMPAFEQASFVQIDEGYRSYVSQRFTGNAERLWWISSGEMPASNDTPWGGPVALRTLLEPGSLLAQGASVLVVSFTLLGETVLDEWGLAFSHAELIENARYLREHGVRIVAEWLIGAPGINETQIKESLAALKQPVFFDWLAGVRRFHWPIDHQQTDRGSQPVTLARPDVRLDLARTRPFSMAGTIEQERLPQLLDELALALMPRSALSPGRVAGAYCSLPPDHRSVGEPGTIRLDPDCALVQLAEAEAANDGWFAVNLRLQKVIAVDRRLIKLLLPLRNNTKTPALALPTIPEAQRSKLVTSLCQHGVLVETTI